MNNADLKLLFNYLDSNKDQLNKLQKEFLLSLKNQYRNTGLLTPWQIENLVIMEEKIQSMENISAEESDSYSGMYSQLQEFSYIGNY